MMGHNLVVKSGNSPFCRSLKLGIQILTEDERKETWQERNLLMFSDYSTISGETTETQPNDLVSAYHKI